MTFLQIGALNFATNFPSYLILTLDLNTEFHTLSDTNEIIFLKCKSTIVRIRTPLCYLITKQGTTAEGKLKLTIQPYFYQTF